MEINEIRLKGGEIDIIKIPFTPDYLLDPPQAIPIYPPVTSDIGVPIVDMPGCVEAHEVDENNMLEEDDPKGVKIYCDAGMPSYNPIDYSPDQLDYEYEAPVPPVGNTDAPEAEAPEIPKDAAATEIECPTEVQQLTQPIGTLTDSGTKKITEYRLIGTQCIPIKEDITIVDQVIKGIPSTNQVTTTASIAIVATAAAAATPLLLKVVKPIVKQIIKRVKKALGKEPPKLSATEIQTNKYREKKGLPPFKIPKKRKY
tara:strand:+ start:1286 stop:2056 length:771 start_codon:yes stop_codon:yes gene_type:complete